MRTRIRIAPLALLALALTIGAPTAAMAATTNCTGVLGAVMITGDLKVQNGATCTLNGTTVTGDIKVEEGGTLDATGVTVGGDVHSNEAKSIKLTDSNIANNVEIEKTSGSPGANELTGNTIGGKLKLRENEASFQVDNNTVNDRIECYKNEPDPMGAGNTAGKTSKKNDECTSLQGPYPPILAVSDLSPFSPGSTPASTPQSGITVGLLSLVMLAFGGVLFLRRRVRGYN